MEGKPVRPRKGSSRRHRPATPKIVLYLTRGNPQCERLRQYLISAGIRHISRDLLSREGSMREYASQTRGRIRLPAVRIGEKIIDSMTPRKIARLLKRRHF